MTIKDSIILYKNFSKIKIINSNAIQYFVAKNTNILINELKILEEQELEILNCCKDYNDEIYKIDKEDKSFEIKTKELKEKYKLQLNEQEEKNLKYQKFIEETESSYKPFTIKYSLIPDKTFEQEFYEFLVKLNLITE